MKTLSEYIQEENDLKQEEIKRRGNFLASLSSDIHLYESEHQSSDSSRKERDYLRTQIKFGYGVVEWPRALQSTS